MDEKQKYEAEKKELNLLIGRGTSFRIDRTIHRRQKGLSGLFKKRVPEKESLSFKIEEPTLSTMDHVSDERIELKIDEKALRGDKGLTEARKLAKAHSRRCAKIIALSVMGSEYEITTKVGARVKYSTDEKRLKELTSIFFHGLKPSTLRDLVNAIDVMSNLGDFCSSIRLMSMTRTTAPTLVEEDSED